MQIDGLETLGGIASEDYPVPNSFFNFFLDQ